MGEKTRQNTLSNLELSAFCEQMAMVLKAGISVMEGVSIMREDAQTPAERELLDDIYEKVQETAGYERYDIVAANILAEVLVPLTPVVVQHMKPGAVYITSGIIDDKEQTVVEAVQSAGLKVLEVNYQGEWVSVVARKN